MCLLMPGPRIIDLPMKCCSSSNRNNRRYRGALHSQLIYVLNTLFSQYWKVKSFCVRLSEIFLYILCLVLSFSSPLLFPSAVIATGLSVMQSNMTPGQAIHFFCFHALMLSLQCFPKLCTVYQMILFKMYLYIFNTGSICADWRLWRQGSYWLQGLRRNCLNEFWSSFSLGQKTSEWGNFAWILWYVEKTRQGLILYMNMLILLYSTQVTPMVS